MDSESLSHTHMVISESFCVNGLKNLNSVPVVVVDGTVLVAKMGATVAAATGVTGLKIDFYKQKSIISQSIINLTLYI